MQSSVTIPRTSRFGLLLMLAAAGAAAAALGGDAAPPASTPPGVVTDRVDQAALDLGRLEYLVVTRSGDNATSCQAAAPTGRLGTIGVPTLVDVNGDLLPDHAVTLVVAPGTPGTTVVVLNVNRLPLAGAVRARVEAVVAPVEGGSGRISFGYDGCEAGAPAVFEERITTSPVRLGLNTTTSPHMPALSLVGSEFTQEADGTRAESRALSARVAPMPTAVYTTVIETAPDTYLAKVRTRQGANVRLQHTETADDGDISTVNAEIGSFPGGLDVSLSPTLIDYTATDPLDQPLSRPIDFVDIETVSSGVGDPVESLRARLEGVPAKGRLERTSPTRVEVTAPQGPIGVATVSYSSVPDGTTTVPELNPVGSQYLVARKVHDLLVAQVRVEELSRALVDAGDPLAGADPATNLQTDRLPTVVEATHRKGPFNIDASVTSRPAESPVDVTRTAVARVFELPRTARVEFGATTQSFAYTGSDDIGLLTADVTSTEAFVDDATEAHLTIKNFPTGLTGRFDEKGKRFTARVPRGEVGLIELLTTNGEGLRLPAGIDGVRLEDHKDEYSAFARVSGLRRIAVGWGDTMLADVAHRPGPFDVVVNVDDPDTADPTPGAVPTDLNVALTIRDLPGLARFTYTPGDPGDCIDVACPTPTSLTFAGDAPVADIDLDVVSGNTLIPSPIHGQGSVRDNVGADEMHLALDNVPPAPAPTVQNPTPPSLALTVDGVAKLLSVDVADSAPGLDVELEACSQGTCGQPVHTGKLPAANPATQDGLWLVDRHTTYHLLTRLTGLDDVEVSWANKVVVHAEHTAGPFDIVTQEEKRVYGLSPVPVVPYVVDTSVAISNLPPVVDLTYDRFNQAVHYDGFGVINSIEAWRSVDRRIVAGDEVVEALAGRATNAHLLVQGLPPNVDLTFAFGETADKTTVDTGGPPIARVELELVSDDSLLQALATSPLVAQGFDGLELWDLDDRDNVLFEAVEDPYVIAVRATNLTSFRYETERVGTPNDFQIEDNTYIDIARTSGPSLWAQVYKTNPQKVLAAIPGLSKSYRFEQVLADFGGAPAELGLAVHDINKNGSALHQVLIDYWASGAGSQLDFRTTALEFERTFVDVSLTGANGVPGGGNTSETPGVHVCLGPNNMRCSPRDRNGGQGQLSYAVHVASPVTIQGDARFPDVPIPDDEDDYQRLTLQNVQLDAGITLSREKDGGDDHFVYADTAGGYVQGRVKLVHHNAVTGTTDRKLDIVMPPGTYAMDRYVEIQAIDTGVSEGAMGCPVGIFMEAEAEGIDFDVTDDMCTGAEVHSASVDGVSPAVLIPGEQQVLTLSGTSFVSPYVETDGTGHRGTRVYFGGSPPLVEILHLAYISPTRLEVTVLTSPNAPRGTFMPIGVDNPVQDPNVHTCAQCVRVAD